MKKWFKRIKDYFTLDKPAPVKCHSTYALMPNGSMKKGSLSLLIYSELMAAYENEYYEDDPDRDAIFAAVLGNFEHEHEIAWQSFISEIGVYDDP